MILIPEPERPRRAGGMAGGLCGGFSDGGHWLLWLPLEPVAQFDVAELVGAAGEP